MILIIISFEGILKERYYLEGVYMIPMIGLMMGCYILTRCFEIGCQRDISQLVRVLAFITIIINVLGVIYLLSVDSSLS